MDIIKSTNITSSKKLKAVKISMQDYDRLYIQKKPDGNYDIIIEKDGKKEYYIGYNKMVDEYTTKSGFTAYYLNDIIAYAIEEL